MVFDIVNIFLGIDLGIKAYQAYSNLWWNEKTLCP
jgi:hypothetical protein